MGVLVEKSVGRVIYQHVDSWPNWIAESGTVAVYSDINSIFTNLDGTASGWTRLQERGESARIFYSGNTTPTNPAAGTWINDNASAWQTQFVDGWYLTGGTLVKNSPTDGYYYIQSESTIVGVTNRIYIIEVGPAINNIAPIVTNWTHEGTSTHYAEIAVASTRLMNNDYINFGKRWTANTGGGPQNGFTITTNSIEIHRLSQIIEIPLFTETFETGTFDNWIVVNGAQTNKWIIGTDDPNSGVYSAYISDNNSAYQYTNTAASTTHFYRDIDFGETGAAKITFNWKCTGENGAGADQYDFGRVYVAPTGITPVAGTLVSSIYITGTITKYNQQATFTQTEIIITNTGINRLIFSWTNDTSIGTVPMNIDNITITELRQ